MSKAVEKILIIRFGVLGDVVLTTPVIRQVNQKYPDAKIDFLIKEKFQFLVKNHPLINQVFTIPENADKNDLIEVVEKLKENKYDLLIDLHNNLRSSIVKKKLPEPQKITYEKDIVKRHLLSKFKINMFKKKVHVAEKYLKTIGNYPLILPEVYSSTEDKEKVQKWINENGLENKEAVIGFNPGAIHYTKRWPRKHFIELGLLLSQYKIKIVLLGGPDDVGLASDIAQRLGDKAVIAAGKFNILETLEVLKNLKFIVTGDTGLMHLANAARTPVIAIFGPTVTEFGFWPYGNDDIVLEKNLSCRPCSLHGTEECPIDTFECMENIEPAEVFSICSSRFE